MAGLFFPRYVTFLRKIEMGRLTPNMRSCGLGSLPRMRLWYLT